MQLPPASRPARVRRLLAISAAAGLVIIAPTACDYGSYGGGGPAPASVDTGGADYGDAGYGSSGHTGHSDTVRSDAVVPVGATIESTAEAAADPAADAAVAPTTDEAVAAASAQERRSRDGRFGRGDRDGRDGRGDGRPRNRPTIPPAAGAPATDPNAPATNDQVAATTTAAAPQQQVLGTDCTASNLERHNGFQLGPRCVNTSFGEVGAEANNPVLLITDAPRQVRPDTPFDIKVSTDNLIRDRFLGAAAGGYYKEASFLDEGIQRGHFHTACRMIPTDGSLPAPDPDPAFFVATQDNGGGSTADTVTVTVTDGLPAGLAQCAVWAGDGSHRIPMMQFANQTPAFDVVRINVGGA
jgi:hypothetical protein